VNSLLQFAIDAHGGLTRWKAFDAIRARLTVRGAVFDAKAVPGFQENVAYELRLRDEKVTTTGFGGPDLQLRFTPDHLVWGSLDGRVIESRDHPRESFRGHDQTTPWDPLHLGYFTSYALWTYLHLPFLYAEPGFVVEEIEPWLEAGETWRRLQATFPESVASHCRQQVTHFGPDGLMRRHDYTVDVLGGASGANYSSNYREIQGIKMPMARRVYAYDSRGARVAEPLLVSIDIGELSFVKT